MSDPKVTDYLQRRMLLHRERQTWFNTWRELSQYIQPRRGRFSDVDKNNGRNRSRAIVDPVAKKAHGVLMSGMMAGLTSPARPWFRLGLENQDLMDSKAVTVWLDRATKRMQHVLKKSNFYNVMPIVYGEQGLFGQAPLLILEDDEQVVRFYPYTAGEYYIAQNARLTVDTIYRDTQLTVRQLVERFGLENCSGNVQSLYRQGTLDQRIDVVHVIEPRKDHDPFSLRAEDKPIASIWFELGSEDKFLGVSGFEEGVIACPRWEVNSTDAYGLSPGMDALGDVKELMFAHKRKQQLIDKLARPPMKGPTQLKHAEITTEAGRTTFVNEQTGRFEPAYVPNPAGVTAIHEEIQDLRQRIHQTFYADLFQMLALSDRRQMTAREVEERHEEKLLGLGPVIERNENELLNIVIERVFSIMHKRGMFEPPPREMEGEELKIEYVSILAQAQRLVGVGAVDRMVGFIGQAASFKPEALDKLDVDETIDEYAAMLGVPPQIIKDSEEVAAIREQRAQMQQQQIALEQAKLAAETGKDLADTKIDDTRNALAAALGQ